MYVEQRISYMKHEVHNVFKFQNISLTNQQLIKSPSA